MCSFLEIGDHFLIGYRGGMGHSSEICKEKRSFENMSDMQTRNNCNLFLRLVSRCDDSRYLKIAAI